MKNTLKNKSFDMNFFEIQSVLFTFYLAIFLFVRGVFFISATNKILGDSAWYLSLSKLMNIEYWGIICIVTSVVLFLSAFTKSKRGFLLYVVGNACASVIYIFFAVTGVNFGLNWFTPFMNILNLNFHCIMTAIGVYVLCRVKKTANL